MAIESDLRWRFKAGLEGKEPRKHQVDCVLQQLACTGDNCKRFLHQHAPGSGKSEVILMLASELLRLDKADSVVILNYATELEEQMVHRATSFWTGLRCTTGFQTPWKRSRSSSDILQPLCSGVLFSLLQKFQDMGEENDDDQQLALMHEENSARIVVIIDEAHRGVPDEGVYISNVLKRFGEEQTQIFFTATPKVDTLQSHGLRSEDAHGVFFGASSIHTQADAVRAKYILNPLEKYFNAVSSLNADGQTLVQLNGKIVMKDFVDRLHKQPRSSLLVQQANYIVDNLRAVYDDMPMMRNQIKHLVVTDSQQSVFDLGERLKTLTTKRRMKNNLGNKIKVAVFFSGMVKDSTGKMIRDREANGQEPDQEMLDKADIVVCCQKFLAGWDEWRVCSIFLCKRSHSEEHLQQLLARATRARPGTGKKRPLIFDLSNHPDDVGAAISRFWSETRHYEGRLGEVKDLAIQIQSFPGAVPSSEGLPVTEVLSCFRATDMLLLRAHIVRYYRAAASISASDSPLSFTRLNELLLQLNLELKEQLFGCSDAVARAEALEASSIRSRMSDLEVASGNGGVVVVARAKTPVAALRLMRSSLQLGRRKRTRNDELATPTKKRAGVATVEQVSTPQAPSENAGRVDSETPTKLAAPAVPRPDHFAEVKEGLKQTVQELADRHWNGLPEEGDPHVEVRDTREEELRLFRFAAFPLRQFACAAVRSAEKSLHKKLTGNLGSVLKASWEEQRAAMQKEFCSQLQTHDWTRQETTEAMQATLENFSEVVDPVGGQAGGWQKRKLLKMLSQYLPPA